MYHQHQEHRQIQQPQHQQQQPSQPQQPQHRQDNNGYNNNASNNNHDVVNEDVDSAAAAATAAMGSAASNLDHALLESLFYNEMSTFEPLSALGHNHHAMLSAPTEHDTPHTIVEKEILRDFGVGQEFGGKALFASPPPEASRSAADNTQYNNVASLHQQQHQQQPYHHQQQHQHQQSNNPLHHQQAQPSSAIQPQYASNNVSATYNNIPTGGTSNNTSAPPATARQQPQQQPQAQGQAPNQMGVVYMDTQATATAAAAAAFMLSNNGGIKLQSNATIPVPVVAAAARPPANAVAPYSNTALPTVITQIRTEAVASNSGLSVINGVLTQQQQNQQQQQQQTQSATNKGSNNSNKAAASAVPSSGGLRVQVTMENGARKLVDQFATLASRLGIDLPDSVLQSLTSAAAKNDPTLLMNNQAPNDAQTNKGIAAVAATLASTINATATKTIALNSAMNSTSNAASGSEIVPTKGGDLAPTVMELRNMAEEAIAAVTQSNMNRTAFMEDFSGAASSQAGMSNSNNPAGSSGNNDSKPTYSKRRKKPRLSDCETKLALLKAENEQLKRHLQNVSNKAHKFDMEKEEAGKQIARLMDDPNTAPREMELSVRKFSDMYSDYGINRQQELSFHLEQLQRLVNPTNFTKMGLWTLGQSNQGSKKNPIAGILVKELDITPQQGRKILDQSEKIRTLCDNLKEAHALLVKLKYLCEKKTQVFQDHMNKCTEILTSKQTVKLIIWINDNTRLLENVCPGWGTEHIQPKK